MNRQYLHHDPRTGHLSLRERDLTSSRITWADIASGVLSIVALVLCVVYIAIMTGLLQPEYPLPR